MMSLFSSAVIVKDEKKDEKKPLANTLTKVMGLVGKKGGSKELKIWLTSTYTNTSANATAQAPVNALIPSASVEYSNLAVLFDEFICEKVECYWDVAVANSNSADIHAAIAYDPINSGAYTRVDGVLEAQQFDGPIHIANSSRNMMAMPVTRTGMWTKVFLMPKGASVKDPAAVSIVGTGQWTATSVSGTAYGYVKSYIEAASAGLPSTQTIFVRMLCRFRSRT